MTQVRRLGNMVTAVPTLDELAANPQLASTLPAATLQGLLWRCIAAQTAVAGALVTTSAQRHGHVEEADALIDVATAAQRLGVSKDWLYHHAAQLPFTVHQGRLLRFSTRGISRYIRSRTGRVDG